MFKVTAQVMNVFNVPASDKFEESYKVQLMGDNVLKDGQVKKELITLSVPPSIFSQLKDKVGSNVTLPISFFAKGGQIHPFYPKQVGGGSASA